MPHLGVFIATISLKSHTSLGFAWLDFCVHCRVVLSDLINTFENILLIYLFLVALTVNIIVHLVDFQFVDGLC